MRRSQHSCKHELRLTTFWTPIYVRLKMDRHCRHLLRELQIELDLVVEILHRDQSIYKRRVKGMYSSVVAQFHFLWLFGLCRYDFCDDN
jgi:hypothetical protein